MRKYFIVMFVLFGCEKKNFSNRPTVTTREVTNVSTTMAFCGGEVLSDGGAPMLGRGVVWGKNHNPTFESNSGYTSDGLDIGSFNSSISNLEPNTSYYLRAYARNSSGTGYGIERAFTTMADLLSTSLNISWMVIETSFSDKFFLITASSCDPRYSDCTIRFDLIFYIEKSKIMAGSAIPLSNGNPQTSDKIPPSEGSYVVYAYLVDDPPRGGYIYATGTLMIISITDGKVFGSFSIEDNLAGYTPKTITGEFKGIPYSTTTIRSH
jgi:hypothetical protein